MTSCANIESCSTCGLRPAVTLAAVCAHPICGSGAHTRRCAGTSLFPRGDGRDAVGATEQIFFDLATNAGRVFARGQSVSGLTSRGHLESITREVVPEDGLSRLALIYAALGGNERLLAAKRAVPLRIDFLDVENRVAVEVDEIQHFTSERKRSLDSYPNDAPIDLDTYRATTAAWKARADRYRAAKPAADFPYPGGRRAQRAYLDAVRDLVLPALGYTVVRIPAPECDGRVAFARFLELTAP